jgi:chromosome segregation protein
MPHLDSVIIHNFKSFKHVNIKFSKGFNCIIGANGSGKSNICDSLLFALGESSLRRMRVPNTSQLINSFAKPKKEDGVKRAYVKINIAADNPLEIARIIKSNNKIGYRLNGKHVTRQEVIESLRSYRSEINETNIIAQGEIAYMINLNSKERRELIDVAAGIKEFNDKKDSAMKELEKVQERMNETQIALNERKRLLSQLEKEKEDAELYLQLTDTVKRISYTLLKNSEAQVEKDFNTTAQTLKTLEQKRKDASSAMKELDLVIEKLSKDRDVLSNNLNKHSVELSSTNKVLEGINKDIAVKETQLKSLKDRIDELELQSSQIKEEQKKLQKESKEMQSLIVSTNSELEQKLKQLSSKEYIELQESGSSQMDKVSQNQKRIDELYAQSEALSRQHLQYKFEIEATEKSTKQLQQELVLKTEEHSKQSKQIKQCKERLNEIETAASKALKEIEKLQADAKQKNAELDNIYIESVNLREQIAVLGGSSDKVNDYLKKNMESGFYGRAYELCTYDSKYDLAVNSAAASRLNYLVVDSAGAAEQAIQLLKGKQLGRASFIPLKDISTKYKEENKDLDTLLDHVKFDKKFEKAFNYIFANTYVVKSISEAKSIGFGKGRFVTLDGELVEQSGIITGGSTKHLQSHAMLESKLKSFDNQKASVLKLIESINLEIENLRKDAGASQAEEINVRTELKHTEMNSGELDLLLENSNKKIADLNSKMEQVTSTYSTIDSKRNAILNEINELRAENEKFYTHKGSSKQKAEIGKGELEKLKELRLEAEQLKIKVATLTKELELKTVRFEEVEKDLKARSEEKNEARKKLALLDSELLELNTNMNQMREKVGKSDASSQEIYRKLQDLSDKITKMSSDRGKSLADSEKLNRDFVEQETRKVQQQTRISDIKAELLSYSNVLTITDITQTELEAKRTIAKNDIERLGAVNLKAPEVYELKKKDVEDANSKIEVLGNEKDSIIAMINEIESKKLNIFTEALNDVNENFQKLYGYIFEGSAALQLENPKDPFNTGLSINIKSPKNKNGTVEALSGGEKSLVIIMLLFAIQTHNPMSMYVFDEIDAALDKENSKKLSRLMKEMSKRSQLIVISHNDSLITAADTAIGVVHRSGESRVVGLQLSSAPIIETK